MNVVILVEVNKAELAGNLHGQNNFKSDSQLIYNKLQAKNLKFKSLHLPLTLSVSVPLSVFAVTPER